MVIGRPFDMLRILSILCIAYLASAATNMNALWPSEARGGATATSPARDSSMPIRVAYQGEPGAYSEKSTRELLGEKVVAIGRPSFESCFRAVAAMECDYACLPVENSLGGSIHENYDLMLRYDLQIIAEHEFRVKHCLLAKPGVKREQIKYAISHRTFPACCTATSIDSTPHTLRQLKPWLNVTTFFVVLESRPFRHTIRLDPPR